MPAWSSQRVLVVPPGSDAGSRALAGPWPTSSYDAQSAETPPRSAALGSRALSETDGAPGAMPLIPSCGIWRCTLAARLRVRAVSWPRPNCRNDIWLVPLAWYARTPRWHKFPPRWFVGSFYTRASPPSYKVIKKYKQLHYDSLRFHFGHRHRHFCRHFRVAVTTRLTCSPEIRFGLLGLSLCSLSKPEQLIERPKQ